MTVRALLFGVLLWTCCLYTIMRGRWEERTASIGFVYATYATVLAVSPLETRFRQIELGVMAVDMSLFLILVGVALWSRKFWPLWVAGLQGLTVLSHLGPLVPHVIPWATGNAVALWSYPTLFILIAATWRQDRERRRAGRSNI